MSQDPMSVALIDALSKLGIAGACLWVLYLVTTQVIKGRQQPAATPDGGMNAAVAKDLTQINFMLTNLATSLTDASKTMRVVSSSNRDLLIEIKSAVEQIQKRVEDANQKMHALANAVHSVHGETVSELQRLGRDIKHK